MYIVLPFGVIINVYVQIRQQVFATMNAVSKASYTELKKGNQRVEIVATSCISTWCPAWSTEDASRSEEQESTFSVVKISQKNGTLLSK